MHQGAFDTKEHNGNGSSKIWRLKTSTTESLWGRTWANDVKKGVEEFEDTHRRKDSSESDPRQKQGAAAPRAANRRAATTMEHNNGDLPGI